MKQPIGHNHWCSVWQDTDGFHLEFNKQASTLYKDFDQAAKYTAKLLAADWDDKPLYLSMSGGSDSELMARIFLECEIPFTPVLLKLGTANQYEVWFAEYWCKQNNITPVVLTLTNEEYRYEVFPKYLGEITTSHFGVISNLYIADWVKSQNGYCVYGVGDINYDQARGQFHCNKIDFALDMYRPGQHPTGFFMYTPEIALSYIWQFDQALDEQSNKMNFYKISPRPKIMWFAQLHDDPWVQRLLALRSKHITYTEPHWYGTREDIIDSLVLPE